MEKDTPSSLRDLYNIFLKYKHIQLFYTSGNGFCISFIAHIREAHLRASHVEELIIQSGSGCVILRDHYRSSDGSLVKQNISITSDEEDEHNLEVDVGTLHLTFHLF